MNNIQQNLTEMVQSNNLRKNLFTLILIFVALFLIAKTVLTYKQASNYQNSENLNYITVSGKAEEYIAPDTLTFNITITEEGKSVSEVTAKAKAKNDKALEILVANGVDKNNVKTESYYVSDKYETVSKPCTYPSVAPGMDMVRTSYPCSSTSNIVGQTLYQTVSVKIRDIEKNANNEQRTKIISELAAQNIKADGFNFTVFDMDAARKNIREKAIENAKADAKRLANELGVSLKEVSSFSENNGGYPVYDGGMYDMKSARAEVAAVAPQSAPELAPGQQKITSNVTLTYSIK